MRQFDLFSGIGGFALAARWCGMETIGFSEIDPYCCKVLAKNFPGIPNYGDIRQLDGRTIDADLITGGFPCQPWSLAGKRQGESDPRHLWPEMARVIAEVQPRFVLGENVAGIIGMALERVCLDLEGLGYEVAPLVIPACAVNAPHRRDRVWIVAHANPARLEKRSSVTRDLGTQCKTPVRDSETVTYTARELRNGTISVQQFTEHDWRLTQREFRGVDAGLSEGLDEGRVSFWDNGPDVPPLATGQKNRVERLRALGNAIVPQVAATIMAAMMEGGTE